MAITVAAVARQLQGGAALAAAHVIVTGSDVEANVVRQQIEACDFSYGEESLRLTLLSTSLSGSTKGGLPAVRWR